MAVFGSFYLTGDSCELTEDIGYVALIHPHTFMFIKTFEDVRQYMIKNTHIDFLVDYGLDRVNLFGPGILLDATWYVLSKKKKDEVGVYFNITANQQEKHKKASLEHAYDDLLNSCENERVYHLTQSKLKIIEGWPFIYWISDGFREKFRENSLSDNYNVAQGLATANNERFVRLWWEIGECFKDNSENQKWYNYSKGGPYNKWYGNNWAVVNWENNGFEIRNIKDEKGKQRSRTQNEKFYFKKGITYTASGSKGVSFRIHPINSLFDVGGSCIFPTKDFKNLEYTIALLNSKIVFYILKCLNPTVNTQVGDLQRIPFVKPSKKLVENVTAIVSQNIEIKKHLNTFRVYETIFEKNPLNFYPEVSLIERLLAYLDYENAQLTLILLNEAITNQLIFEVYSLSSEDRQEVENKMGKPVGELPIITEARDVYLSEISIENQTVKEFIQNLAITNFEEQQIQIVKEEFASMYQSNNDLEEYCIRHQLNPINVWYWFRESKAMPQGRAAEIALEFLADACRTILMEDEDGIIPLVGLPGEPRLLDRLEQQCLNQSFTSAQFMQLDGLLGRPINEYMEHYFFKSLSDHLNLFMYLPKTPFIWHLSSGEHQGFEAYIIIYKWNRDSLYKLKTQYLSKRAESLEFRQIQLADINTAQAQNEKERIRLQLQEITEFTKKIDELIAEGYDPKLDDGVGKNIAPLQKKGLLRHDVLNAKQLEKYLKADW